MSGVTGRPVTKGWLARVSDGEIQAVFTFQFNPSERTRSRDIEYTIVSPVGSTEPTAEFRSVSGTRIVMTLLLDATENYDEDKEGVGAQLAWLESCTEPDIDRFNDDIGQFIAPNELRYGMGKDSWNVVMTRFNPREVRWNKSGFTTRAYVDIELQSTYRDIAAIKARLNRLKLLRSKVETGTVIANQ